MLIAALGIAIGLVVGASLPFVVDALCSGMLLPIPLAPTLALGELGVALALRLADGVRLRARRRLGAPTTFRSPAFSATQIEPGRAGRASAIWWRSSLSVAALIGLAVFAAYDRRIALMFVGAAAASFALLRLVALGIMALARRLPRPRQTGPRLALANVHRPGALTPSLRPVAWASASRSW